MPKEPEMTSREMRIPVGKNGGPASVNLEERSVEIICASESPVLERAGAGMAPTVLLMSGCKLPENGQLPLLNTHNRTDAKAVIGSVRDLRVEGDKLIGRAFFSASDDVEPIWRRVVEGHLTDLSVGRIDGKAEFVPHGRSADVAGRSFSGPCRVVPDWRPWEISVCAVGADASTKMRSMPQNDSEEKDMSEQKKEEMAAAPAVNEAAKTTETKPETPPAAPETPAAPEPANRSAEAPAAPDGPVGLSYQDGIEAVERCNQLGITGEAQKKLLAGARTKDQLNAAILDHLTKRSADLPNAAPQSFTRADTGRDERTKTREVLTDALLMRANAFYDQREIGKGGEFATRELARKPAEGWQDFENYSLVEMTRRCLQAAGQPQNGDLLDMVGRAFLYSDLKVILDNVSNKIFETSFREQPSTWREWVSTGSVPDFRLTTLATMGGLTDLDKIVDDVGYQYGRLKSDSWTFSIDTWGKLYAIYRHMIINDEWGIIEEMNRMMGEVAARKLGDLPYDLLTDNPQMKDGNPLFDTSHNNVITPATADINTELFSEARRMAALQRDWSSGRALGLRLTRILTPVALEDALRGFLATTTFVQNGGATSVANIYNNAFRLTAEPRLDDVDPKSFYIVGDQRTVRMFFLRGRQEPYLETRTGWTVDGNEYKVRIDAAAVPMSWQTMIKVTLP